MLSYTPLAIHVHGIYKLLCTGKCHCSDSSIILGLLKCVFAKCLQKGSMPLFKFCIFDDALPLFKLNMYVTEGNCCIT